MKQLVAVGLVTSLAFSVVGGCGARERDFRRNGGAGSGGASAGASGMDNPSEAGQSGADTTAGAGPEGGMAGDANDAGAGGTLEEMGGGGGATPTCNACANGFACSTTTCKTSCSADTDCLADRFCSAGQCRLDAVQVSIGHSHACVLLADKTVSCWGKNDQSQLGTASTSASATPVQVKFLSDVQSIAAGDGITFALLTDGTVVFWGSRYTSYNLGTGQFITAASQYPTLLNGLSAVKQIAAGGRGNGCAMLADGSVRCWGINDMGQLGNGTYDLSVDPVVVSGVNGASGIAFGYAFACAQTPSAVQCWGNNFNGQLGTYADTTSSTQQTITGLSGTVSKLRAGDVACVLMTNGSVQCWGLGYDANGAKGIPVTVSAIPGATDLALGGQACALASGTVRCSGWNPVTMPTTVQGISSAIAVAAGGGTTCATLSNGSVKCWGRVVGTESTDYASPTTIW